LDATLDNIEMQFRLKNPMYYYFLLQAQKIIINRKLRDTKLLTNVLNDRKNKLVDSEIETRKPLAEQHQTAIKLRSNNDERSTNHCKAEIIRDDRN
jgi:hypothetical protein